jgi:hypothetical protein
MKLLVVVALAVLGGGCDLGAFDVTENVPAQTIPGNPADGVASTALTTSMSLSSSDLPGGLGFVTAVTLKSATFTITAPAGGTFDFVDSVTLSIVSPSNEVLTATQIAAGHPSPGSTTLALEPTGSVNLLPFVRAGALVNATGAGHQPTVDTTFDGTIVLTVHP